MPEIRPEFQAHKLNEHGHKLAHSVSEILSDALTKIEALLGNHQSRELSLVVTTLQTAAFWARRAIAIQPSNQHKP